MPKPGVAPPFNSQRPPGTAYTVVWDRRQPPTKPISCSKYWFYKFYIFIIDDFIAFYDVMYSSLCSFAIIPTDCYGVVHKKVCNIMCFI